MNNFIKLVWLEISSKAYRYRQSQSVIETSFKRSDREGKKLEI